jgi:hypothetical protein
MNTKIIATKLHSMENGILGAINNSEIQSELTRFGYPPGRMTEGKELLERVVGLTAKQSSEYGGQYAATDEQNAQQSDTYARYMITVKVVRVAFKKKPAVLAQLNATGERPRSLSGWLSSARILYTNLLNTPDLLTVMAGFGYDPRRLQEELQAVEEVEKLHSKQLSEKSGAQQSTKERDKAFDDLCNWYSDFRAIARVALYHKPQLLEALGIVKK